MIQFIIILIRNFLVFILVIIIGYLIKKNENNNT